MKFLYLLLPLFQFDLSRGQQFESTAPLPKVQTSYGPVSGVWKNDAAVFLGIPFARPPVDTLRFKKPEVHEKWNETVVADRFGFSCQTAPSIHAKSSSEDCLYLNVFSFSTKPKVLLPVIVFIHGGNFETGSAEDLSERGIIKNLVSKGLVVVTFNYRLNYYGFFTTMSEDFPPNLGLWDQWMALKWVREEIQYFGGDPYQITLAGQGSGAASVALHLRSPYSSGMFARAILQSGSVYCPFALSGNRYKIESSKIVATAMGCISEPDFAEKRLTPEAISCLKPTQGKLWNTIWRNFSDGVNVDNVYQGIWAPVVDGDFVPDSLEVLAKNVQIMIGATNNEKGISELSSLKSAEKPSFGDINNSDFELAVANLARPEAFPKSFRLVSDLLTFTYGIQSPSYPSTSLMDRKIDMTSDYWMKAPIAKEIRYVSQKNNTVYLYSFDYVSTNFYENISINVGAVHGMDTSLLLAGNETVSFFGLPEWKFGKKDKQIQQILSSYWYNFAKTGNPNTPLNVVGDVWLPLGDSADELASTRYLCIDAEPKMKNYFARTADRLWNWMVPRISTDPAASTVGAFGNKQQLESVTPSLDKGSSSVYYILMWVLIVVVILVIMGYFVTLYIYKRKIRSYHFLKRVEELNFTYGEK